MCHTQELGSNIQGQGHNQGLKVKYFLCNYLKLAEAHCVPKLKVKVKEKQKLYVQRQYSSQGKLILVREKSGKFALLKLWTP